MPSEDDKKCLVQKNTNTGKRERERESKKKKKICFLFHLVYAAPLEKE